MNFLDKIKEALTPKTDDFFRRNSGKKIEAKVLWPEKEEDKPEYENAKTDI